MNIALIAHDAKKKLMQNFCIAYRGILSKNELYATGTTGRLIEEVTNLNVHKYLAGHLGGEQQIGAQIEHNEIDLVHSNFLLQITELLEHNDFLTAQSQKIREFYKYMAHEYPFLAFTFKGRIKSLIRAEEKFNGYVVEYIYDYYRENGVYPPVSELKNKLSCFRDFIAYRIVVCLPRCHLKPGEDQEQASIRYLYKIANVLPGFLEERGFTAESAHEHVTLA